MIIGAILPFFFEKERIVDLIEDEINSRLDIKANFNDDINLTFFPIPTLEIKGLSFLDNKKNINLVITLTKVSTSWASLIQLKPKIQEIKLVSPELKIQENNISRKYKNLKILAGNSSSNFLKKLDNLKGKIKRISIEDRKKIKKAVLEAHKHGEVGGYGGKMSHYISVKDSDYDVLRKVVALLKKNKS